MYAVVLSYELRPELRWIDRALDVSSRRWPRPLPAVPLIHIAAPAIWRLASSRSRATAFAAGGGTFYHGTLLYALRPTPSANACGCLRANPTTAADARRVRSQYSAGLFRASSRGDRRLESGRSGSTTGRARPLPGSSPSGTAAIRGTSSDSAILGAPLRCFIMAASRSHVRRLAHIATRRSSP